LKVRGSPDFGKRESLPETKLLHTGENRLSLRSLTNGDYRTSTGYNLRIRTIQQFTFQYSNEQIEE
ncbi:MAG: hypothetical protein KDD35_01130, partial [Bdellovibrionales bacterium]|nr:hypothetical protein [Bdellovibrionales bacterium]